MTKFSPGRLFIYFILVLFCAIYLMPLLVMLLTSFKSLPDIRGGNLLSFPGGWGFYAWF